ncbi:BTAD domain-containing putative transcriptional regulator [Actinokineospora sp. UTMC 2448]|uniref:AfsR/SARP family transcriptional regulator n=1 Tax=Actinokineospora sp. UTMC 2448 TaxID=2268449 RepID=UPI00216405D7|nr:BTAD domain-containing putative transcriptional regulator [Actinokineospora sp. UTMC 2448]UVS79255.1 Regulatory protein AfsR [Actinokineospora sp. UTMC 2448]
MPRAHAVEFTLLGPVGVHMAGQPRPLGGPRQRAVLVALLLHANEVVRTRQLLDLVWSDLPTSAESNLRTYLTRLRRILRAPDETESRLQTRRGGHLVTAHPGELDVDRFTELAARGEQAEDPVAACDFLERALRTWRGRALEDVATGHWLEAEATRLESLRERVYEQYLHTRLSLGHHAEVLPELRALLLRNPLWERMAGMLMVALHRSGQRTEALSVFRRTRNRLVEELGVEPGHELSALHQRLLSDEVPGVHAAPIVLATRPDGLAVVEVDPNRADGSASARVTGTTRTRDVPWQHRHRPPTRAEPGTRGGAERPAQLPVDLPTFTGREAELAELTAEAVDDRPIITIVGMPGSGKTTLAVHAAHRLAERYPDGQLFLDLHGHTDGADPLDPNEALGLMLRALGVPATRMSVSTEARAGLYRSLLADRRMLVVLDNALSEAQVSPLLPGAGASRTLITSRGRLTGLAHQAHSLPIDVLPLADAVSLFTTIATPQRVAAEPPGLVAEVVELCGRLPLAIRLAAVRLRDRPFWTLADIRDRLGDPKGRLAELSAGEHGVSAAIDRSVAHLEPDRRRMLTLLGLHPGAVIDLNAAAALAGVSLPAADRVLEDLVDAHLLRQTAPDRYESHSLVRAFVLERAQGMDQQDVRDAMRRLLDFYLHTVDACDSLIHPVRRHTEPPPPDPVVVPLRFTAVESALAWCDAVCADLPGVVEAAGRHGLLAHACQVALRLEGYFDARERWAEGTATYEAALGPARMLHDQEMEAELLLGMAFGRARQRQYESALAYYEATVELCGHTEVRYIAGFAVMGLAEVSRRLGRYDQAIENYRRAVALYRGTNDVTAICANLDRLGSMYRELDMVDEAIECYRQACEQSEQAGNPRGAARFLITLGQAYLTRDRYEEATAVTTRALALCAAGGDRDGQNRALTALGRMRTVAGERDQAMAHLATAQGLLADLDDHSSADACLPETHPDRPAPKPTA